MAVDVSGLEALIRDRSADLVGVMADLFVETARAFAPVDTGALQDSINVTSEGGAFGGGFSASVECSSEYGIYQELGTGVYGPAGHEIEPGHVMVFPGGDEGTVFTMRTRGVRPRYFWRDTVALWPQIVRNAESAI